jgi:AcrR family transcriptional regulator
MASPATLRKTASTKLADKTLASRLGRDDWLDAAFRAAVEHGFDGVRVLTLADTLQVTRGSFYWHFKDHATLIEALVERWQSRELEAHQRLEHAGSADPAQALEILLDQALAHGGEDLDNMRFELALRALGRRDTHVASLMRNMDDLRIALFKRKFMALVQDDKTAAELATLFYLSVVGSFHALIQPHMRSASKQFFLDIIAKYLVHQHKR